MKTIKHLLLGGFSLLLLSCGGKKSGDQPVENISEVPEYPITISFAKGIDTEQEVRLSEIAREVKVVPLETKPECLVAKVSQGMIQMVDHNLFIPCSEGLLQFTDDGKFVRSVVKRGQGPGEYSIIRFIAANDRLKQIYIMDNGRILTYTIGGDYVGESKIPFCWQFTLLGDSAYVGYIYNNTGQKKDRLVLVDRQGETLNTFPQYDQFTKKPVVKSIIMIRSLRLPRNGLNPAISWIWESIRYRKKGVLKFWKEIGKPIQNRHKPICDRISMKRLNGYFSLIPPGMLPTKMSYPVWPCTIRRKALAIR